MDFLIPLLSSYRLTLLFNFEMVFELLLKGLLRDDGLVPVQPIGHSHVLVFDPLDLLDALVELGRDHLVPDVERVGMVSQHSRFVASSVEVPRLQVILFVLGTLVNTELFASCARPFAS